MSVGANARLIAVLTAAARLAGFVRMLVFAACVGTTTVGTAYQSANTVPNVVFEIAAGGVLAAIVVPLVAARLGRGERAEADAIASALLTWAAAVLLPLVLIVAALAPLISRWLLDSAAAVELGTRMLWVFAPQIVLYGIGIVLSGVLNAHERFAAAAVAPLVSSLVVIATYVAYWLVLRGGSPSAAVWVLAGGTSLGVLALVATLVPTARRLGIRLHPTLRFPPGVAAAARRLAGAGLIALLAQQISVLAVLWLANNRAAVGTINGYQYVQAVYLLPYAVLAVPLATAAYPVLAAAEGQGAAAATTVAHTARRIVVLGGLAGAVLIAAADDVGAFFGAIDAGRRGVGAQALAALPATLRAFAPGLIGFGLAALLTRALYVRGSARRGALVMAGGWLVAALLPLILVGGAHDTARTLRLLGVGSSIGMTLAGLGLLALTRRSWGSAALAGVPRALPAAIMAALFAASIGRALRASVPAADSAVTAVLAAGLIGGCTALVYLLWLWVFDGATLRLLLPGRPARIDDPADEDAEVTQPERTPGEGGR
ncbi:murein biosynthesis integral membrane protein MurJ [Nostocoides australiense]|nr:lipid II flippase MurJ [Tetrasphaera australiensis]